MEVTEKTKTIEKLLDNFSNDLKMVQDCYPGTGDLEQQSLIVIGNVKSSDKTVRTVNITIGKGSQLIELLMQWIDKDPEVIGLMQMAIHNYPFYGAAKAASIGTVEAAQHYEDNANKIISLLSDGTVK